MPPLSESGTYELAARTTDEPYLGKFRQMNVFIVGYGTDKERVFTLADRLEARAYAQQNGGSTRLSIFKVNASQLPENVGYDLYGA